MKSPPWIGIAAILGGVAVMVGAFGTHSLPSLLEKEGCPPEEVVKQVEQLKTGAQYQMYHALAILIVGALARSDSRRALHAAAGLFVVGMLCFSGGLYWLATTGNTSLHLIVPLGGASYIAGWLTLGLASLHSPLKQPIEA